jgi:hypothetical protein
MSACLTKCKCLDIHVMILTTLGSTVRDSPCWLHRTQIIPENKCVGKLVGQLDGPDSYKHNQLMAYMGLTGLPHTCAGSQIKHFFWLRYWRLEKFAFEDQHEDVVTINTLLTTFLNEDKTERRAISRAVCSASHRSAPSNVLPNKHGSCHNISVSVQPSEKQIRGRTHRRPCSNL